MFEPWPKFLTGDHVLSLHMGIWELLWFGFNGALLLFYVVCRCRICARTGHSPWLGLVWACPSFAFLIPSMAALTPGRLSVAMAACILCGLWITEFIFRVWLAFTPWGGRSQATVKRRARRVSRERARA